MCCIWFMCYNVLHNAPLITELTFPHLYSCMSLEGFRTYSLCTLLFTSLICIYCRQELLEIEAELRKVAAELRALRRG